jgi:hypothetical protein
MENDIKYLKELLEGLNNAFSQKNLEIINSGQTISTHTVNKLKIAKQEINFFGSSIRRIEPYTNFRKGFEKNYKEILQYIKNID